jgi:DNA polymerase-3 subunit gamma/tau
VTVLSRCLQFNLRPMAPETVLEHLQKVLEAEQIQADLGALRLLSRAARGSMRDALSLTDQAIAFGSGALQEAGVRQMLGAVDRSHVYRLIDSLGAGDGAAVVSTANELRAQGLSAQGALEEMAAVLQQMAVVQVVPEAADAGDPEAETLQRLAGVLPPEETQLLYSIALHGRNELGLAPDEYSGLTMVLLRMLAFKPVPGSAGKLAAAPLQRTQNATTRVPARPAPTPVPPRVPAAVREPMKPVATASSQPAARPQARPSAMQEPPPWVDDAPPDEEPEPAAVRAPVVSPAMPAVPAPAAASVHMPASALGDRWHALVRQMIERELIGALVRELAMQCELLAPGEPGGAAPWKLRVERETLASESARAKLEAAMTEVLGLPAKLVLDVGPTEDTPARREAAQRALRQQEAEQAIQNDPLVQSLMQQFSTARIVPGSIRPV